jgi:hypothetical protein
VKYITSAACAPAATLDSPLEAWYNYVFVIKGENMSTQFTDCPKCHGYLDADNFEADGESVWRTVRCHKEECGFEYSEVYTFTLNESPYSCVELDDKGEPINPELHKKRLADWGIK